VKGWLELRRTMGLTSDTWPWPLKLLCALSCVFPLPDSPQRDYIPSSLRGISLAGCSGKVSTNIPRDEERERERERDLIS
jgi:hypothetical protein